ncbi:MAG: tRNA (adenosine(37)-N6)-threonylcarbamoyltransferase complex dimerization subunit type 1 TsaB [Verrucomicrobiota bacterium]|nr:tRNA (adenosine(37)-N6)-threonylcarbamoyltransferase complex dimerization subunit type 1 TsaB [Verrucomicrobiota bacterium]
MNVLALEFSTDQASVALLKDGEVAARANVAAGLRKSQELFPAVERLLASVGWAFQEVDVFAVGRGPGSYTGLRVSLTAAQGWALPAGKTVWTLSSAAALAAEWLAENPSAPSVVVWGSVRRQSVWAAEFERDGLRGNVRRNGEWRVLAEEARMEAWPNAFWVEAGRAPQAEWVGRLYFMQRASEELEPIYLHPAVATPPRFDADGRPVTPDGFPKA